MPMLPRLHIVGRKNHGKTTLLVDLVQILARQGRRVATIKHTHHQHELDTPGKDSYRHRQAGAERVGILSPERSAVFWPSTRRTRDGQHDHRYDEFAALLAPCELVLVEGDSQTAAPKLEVWRAELDTLPIAAADRSILAVVSDGDPPVDCPVLRRDDPDAIVAWILDQLELEPPTP